MNEMAISRSPEVIATEINVIKAQARDTYVRSAIEIGRRLYEAKTMVPHGKWGEWLKNNVDYSERTAQNLMAVYEEYGRNGETQAIAGLSFTQAVLLLQLDGESRAELLEREDVSGMSTRELQEEIRKANAEIEKRQVTIDQLMGKVESLEGGSASPEDQARETELETARSELDAERAASDALREELRRAKIAAESARVQATDAVERANAAAQENVQLKKELDAEKARTAPELVFEQIEVTPPEVERELEQLREQARTAPNKEIILLRDAYETLTKQFGRIEDMIANLEGTQPEEAARYRRAVATAARKMAERLGA